MAVAEAPSRVQGARRAAAGGRFALGALVVIELVAWWAVLRNGGWAYDDNMWMGMARANGFTGHWLTANLFGHWAIGYNATFSLLDAVMPIDYRYALVVMLACLAAAAVLLGRSVEMLVGGRRPAALAAAYLGISVLLIRSLEWFSQGLQTAPTLLCDLLCLWAYVRYQRDPRNRWVAVSAGAIGAGLLFYEKPFFMPLYLLLLRASYLTSELRWRSFLRALWRERRIWLAYFTVLAAYVVAREAVGAGSVGVGPSPSASQMAQALWLMWAKSLVPGLFALALPSYHVNTFQLAIGCLLQVSIVVIVITSIRRKPIAWRCWAALAICLLATWIVVGVARVGILGPEAATDQRYLIDFAWLVPLFVSLAFSPHRSFTPDAPTADAQRGALRPGILAAAAMSVALYIAGSVATAANWQDGWAGPSARNWEHNVQSGLAALDRQRTHAILADNLAPVYVVQPSFVPYSYLSQILPQYGPPIASGGVLSGPLIVVDASGRLRYGVTSRPIATFTVRCRPRTTLQRPIRGLDPNGGPYYVRLSYTSRSPGQLQLYVDGGSGYPSTPSRLVDFARGSGQSLAWLGPGTPHGVRLGSTDDVCLRRIALLRVTESARAVL